MDKELKDIELSGGFEWTPGSPWPPYVGAGSTASLDSKFDTHYETAGLVQDQMFKVQAESPYNDGWTQDFYKEQLEHSDAYYDYNRNDPDRKNPFTDPKDRERAFKVTGEEPYIYESPDGGETVTRRRAGSLEKEVIQKPQPDLKGPSHHKYQEDKGIKDLQDYVTSTYQGHYTNKNSDTQTLDLIHSVGDAESFCRSNAIKYLSRYDKKGSAKQDILKAMHYCLLLYYFSGNTQEPDYTNARYETF